MEFHSTRRFAWERKHSEDPRPRKVGGGHPYTWILVVYNLVYWVPIVLPVTPAMSYRDGVVGLTVLIAVRAALNLVRNNLLSLDQAEVFPFRIP
ncbi:MAG: hypothetical protein EP329_12010 [Deltaproteobacteria bacterium]|nr:MAG: hypothetical protein EP329_12010 [Deltaproteobacteria bacterium]